MAETKRARKWPRGAPDETEANLSVLRGVRQTLVEELAAITRLTNEHIAACDVQIAALERERRNAGADDAGS